MEFISKSFSELTQAELYEILRSRAEIFVAEQKICYCDMDGVDYDALHCFFWEDGRVTAYMRAFYLDRDASLVKLGRVLTLEHGRGLGARLMEKGLEAVKKKMAPAKVCISAQKHAVGFYEKFGFESVSGEFLEEGIIHIDMVLKK